MKTLLKKLIAYDRFYPLIKDSFFYQSYKKYRAQLANSLYENPSKDFFVIGITGTNGKTTTVNLLHKILNDNVAPTLAISTAVIKIWNEELRNEKKMTALDNFDLQQLIATAKERGCKIAVIEVSSHGLDQSRFEGIKFDFAVLTNITRDHLDYHGTMEKYAESKKKLFRYVLANNKEKKYAAICVDDKYGKKRFEEMAFDKKISFSLQASSVLKATHIQEHFEGTYFEFSYLGQKFSGTTQLIGKYNVENILAALCVSSEIWLEIPLALKSIENFPGVVGRMEPVYTTDNIKFYIDFAHTPDGLEKTLSFAATNKGNGKLILVCGAPGNRDKEKRPMMGDIAVKYADIVIFSDDDPDTENRLKILNDMTKNLQSTFIAQHKEAFIIPEREYAIQFAAEIANPGDIVVFAGKGHETMQLTNFGKRPRSDKEILLNLLHKTGKQLLNASEVKRQYLEEMKDKKSPNHISAQQYFSGTSAPSPQVEQEKTSNTLPTWEAAPEETQKPSWMFRRVE